MIVTDLDWRAPLDAFAPLAETPFAALLHAGEGALAPGWSVIAAFPSAIFEARGGAAFIDGRREDAPPFEAFRRFARARAPQTLSPLPAPFLSGLCGFAGYEMGAALEPTAAGPASPFALPDMAFGAYDALALFDRRARRAYIAARRPQAGRRLAEALGRPGASAPAQVALRDRGANFTGAAYCAAVEATVEKIRDGAIFQANLARQPAFQLAAPARAFDLFRHVAAGDAPFAAYLQYKEGAVVSASPERFFRTEADGRILAEPIKGTRPRGRTPAEDDALAAGLLADPKERAENVMIADLARNDLSRICRDGSIREEAVCALESYAGVHHLVSRISGVLREGAGAVEALEALFPCGSVTGAPKIEAMKTIAAAEGVGRGPYCGALGYIDDRGHADFSVLIRTLIVEPDGAGLRATLPVGGGVTLRSDPQAEYRETLDKAASVLRGLGAVEPQAESAA